MCSRQSPAKFSHAVMFFKLHSKLDVVSIWLYIGGNLARPRRCRLFFFRFNGSISPGTQNHGYGHHIIA